MKAIPGPSGLLGWEYDTGGASVIYDAADVLHIRSLSWEDDPRGLMGTSPIKTLAPDLDADLELAKATARTAATGRPAAVYRPTDDKTTWNPRIVQGIKDAFRKVFSDNHGGVAILDGSGKLDVIGWSPKDMEGLESRTWSRQTVLSVFAVPPTIAGIPDAANFATAQQEAVTYWTRNMARSALLDDAWTRLAKMWDDNVSVSHDYSKVPALQDSQGAALNRVQQWVNMGADPAVAATYEGFTDQPANLWMPETVEVAEVVDVAPEDDARAIPSVAVVAVDDAALREAADELDAAIEVLRLDIVSPELRADAIASLDAARFAITVFGAERSVA